MNNLLSVEKVFLKNLSQKPGFQYFHYVTIPASSAMKEIV